MWVDAAHLLALRTGLLCSEGLWVRADRVWLHYTAPHNSERAWGFKLRATPVGWRARSQAAALALPHASPLDLLSLLAERRPKELLRPSVLANLLRYLRSGGAPCKERVCHVLLRVLPHATLRDVDFDWARFGSLEAIVEWHEEQRVPPAGSQARVAPPRTALVRLPATPDAVEARVRLQQLDLPPP